MEPGKFQLEGKEKFCHNLYSKNYGTGKEIPPVVFFPSATVKKKRLKKPFEYDI
jgi:hypothetical protein